MYYRFGAAIQGVRLSGGPPFRGIIVIITLTLTLTPGSPEWRAVTVLPVAIFCPGSSLGCAQMEPTS